MRGLILLCFGVLSLGLTGCSDNLDYDHGSPWSYNYPDSQTSDTRFEDWNVTCDSTAGNDCPNTTAQFLTKTGSHMYACTTELVGNDLMIANSHCFGEHGEDPQEICRNTVVIFPSNSSLGKERVKCAKFLVKSDITEHDFKHPDYSVFQLEHPVKRGFLKVTRTGLAHHQQVHISRINPHDAGYGTLETSKCTIVHKTFFDPESDKDDSPIQIMKDCQVMGGNSGSAITDDKNNLVGLLYAMADPDALHRALDSKLPGFADQLNKHKPAFVTNATCINYPFANAGPISPNCAVAPASKSSSDDDDMEFDKAAITKQIADDVERQLREKKINEHLGYKPDFGKADGLEVTVTLKPYCFQDPSKWITASSSLNPLASEAAKISTAAPRWRMSMGINDDIQLTSKAERLTPAPYEISYQPLRLLTVHKTTVSYQEEVTGWIYPRTETVNAEWGVCAEPKQ